MARHSNNPQLAINPRVWKFLPLLLLAPFIFVTVWTSFYTVGAEEVGVVTRWGRFVETTEPGLKWALPFGIEHVEKVPVERQLKQEFGFRTLRADVRTEYDPTDFPDESLMVTGDLNAVDVQWIVQYRIQDVKSYIYHLRDVEGTLRNAAESVMREVVGDRTVDEVLTTGRSSLEKEAEQKLQELMTKYEIGIRIDQLVLQDINPPESVKASFNEVNQAQQARERVINEAWAEYNKVVPRARGEAEQGIQQAQGYAIQRTNEAKGDADRFEVMLQAYRNAPEVTRRRMYLETMQRVLPRLGRKIVIDDEARSVLPLLQLGAEQEPPRP